MKREEFVQNIINNGKLTSNDEILLQAMEYINDYLEPIRNNLKNENLDTNAYRAEVSKNSGWITDFKNEIIFERFEDYILVRLQPRSAISPDFKDKLLIKGNKVFSEKYDLELSPEVLESYFEIFK